MSVWSKIGNIISGGLVEQIGKIVDSTTFSKEERAQAEAVKAQLQAAALQAERQFIVEVEQIKAEGDADLRRQIVTEIQSQDPFVRRARPAAMWGVNSLIIANYGLPVAANLISSLMVSLGNLWSAEYEMLNMTAQELPQALWWFAGAVNGFYSVMRSIDKGAKLPFLDGNGGK